MSFDDYVRHMTQKYRLATAIAVLKAKPSNLSVEEYIGILQSKISDEIMDTDFLDISLGSDDFNFDDDNVVINDDYDFNNNAERASLNDNDIDMDKETNSLEKIMNLLREVDGYVETGTKTAADGNISQRTFCESSQTSETNQNYYDVEMQDINNTDTQIDKTQDLQSVANRSTTKVNNNLSKYDNANKNYFDNFEFNSDTYSDIVKSVKNDTMQREMAETVLNNINKEANESLKSKTNKSDVNNIVVNKLGLGNETSITENQNAIEDYDVLIETQHTVRNNILANKVCGNLERVTQSNINDSQSTVLYSLPGYTQDFTHVSQSQYDNIKIHDNFIHGNKKYNEKDTNATETRFPSNPYNYDAIIKSKTCDDSNITHAPQIIDVASSEIQYIIDKKGRKYRILEEVSKVDDNNHMNTILNTNTNADFLNNTTINQNEVTNADCSNNTTMNQNEVSQEVFGTHDTDSQSNAIALNTPDKLANTCKSKDKTEEEKLNLHLPQEITEILDDDITAVSQEEVIPFKVAQELNKIKTFLNKKIDRRASTDSYSTESGYRSDSQSKSSFKSALLLSGNADNQSGHCLYTYILQCPLVESTKVITNEIATMLGRLIDKLHENEKYPSFLEDILESIDSLLQDINEGVSSSDAIILIKDENIQRLLLLNKSTHVLKYTINKITKIIEELHTHLTKEDNLYELANIDLIENVCYIFHILEILIKRYKKSKIEDLSSQNSTQNSQDSEGILKKSSITDIWRKKWNPEYKNVKSEGSTNNKCVLNKCGKVLNKVIVDCMEGYSLVSFAALQCFNLLQS